MKIALLCDTLSAITMINQQKQEYTECELAVR